MPPATGTPGSPFSSFPSGVIYLYIYTFIMHASFLSQFTNDTETKSNPSHPSRAGYTFVGINHCSPCSFIKLVVQFPAQNRPVAYALQEFQKKKKKCLMLSFVWTRSWGSWHCEMDLHMSTEAIYQTQREPKLMLPYCSRLCLPMTQLLMHFAHDHTTNEHHPPSLYTVPKLEEIADSVV